MTHDWGTICNSCSKWSTATDLGPSKPQSPSAASNFGDLAAIVWRCWSTQAAPLMFQMWLFLVCFGTVFFGHGMSWSSIEAITPLSCSSCWCENGHWTTTLATLIAGVVWAGRAAVFFGIPYYYNPHALWFIANDCNAEHHRISVYLCISLYLSMSL